MDERKRLMKNTGIIAVGNLSTKLVSFLLLPLYTAILSTEEYGTVDYIITISTFCVPFISLLMDESMFRFLIDARDNKDKSKVISNSLAIILIGAVVFAVVAIPVLAIIKYQYTFYLILYIISAVMSGMMSALLRGIGRTDKYAVFNLFMSLTQILLNVFLIAVLHMGIEGMLWSAIISNLAISAVYFVRQKLWIFFKIKEVNIGQMKEMIAYSIPLIPNKISWSIINLSDRIIVMNWLGSNYSGLLAVAHKFPNLMDTVYGFFYQSWKESSARVMNTEGQNQFYNQVYNYLKRFMYAVVLMMVAFMPLVFHILINSSYNDAIKYIPILLIATYFSNISGFYGGIFTAYKKTKIMGTSTVAAAIFNIVVHFALLSWLGLYASAISTLMASVIVYFYRKVKVKLYVKLEEDKSNTIVSIIATAAVLICFYSFVTVVQIIGALVALVFSCVTNMEIIKIILSKMLSLRSRQIRGSR